MMMMLMLLKLVEMMNVLLLYDDTTTTAVTDGRITSHHTGRTSIAPRPSKRVHRFFSFLLPRIDTIFLGLFICLFFLE